MCWYKSLTNRYFCLVSSKSKKPYVEYLIKMFKFIDFKKTKFCKNLSNLTTKIHQIHWLWKNEIQIQIHEECVSGYKFKFSQTLLIRPITVMTPWGTSSLAVVNYWQTKQWPYFTPQLKQISIKVSNVFTRRTLSIGKSVCGKLLYVYSINHPSSVSSGKGSRNVVSFLFPEDSNARRVHF